MSNIPPPPPPGYQAAQPLSPSDEKLWGMLAHLGGIISFLPSLLIYLILKDRSAFVAANARNALNFQILIGIVYVVSAVLVIVVIGGFTWIAAAVVSLIFSIIGGLAANRGEVYQYPITIPLVK